MSWSTNVRQSHFHVGGDWDKRLVHGYIWAPARRRERTRTHRASTPQKWQNISLLWLMWQMASYLPMRGSDLAPFHASFLLHESGDTNHEVASIFWEHQIQNKTSFLWNLLQISYHVLKSYNKPPLTSLTEMSQNPLVFLQLQGRVNEPNLIQLQVRSGWRSYSTVIAPAANNSGLFF